MKDKIKALLEKEERNFEANTIEDIETIYFLLEQNGIINYDVVMRTDNSGFDVWLQGEYYNETIKATIIFDYEINENVKDIDELVEDIERANAKIHIINNLIAENKAEKLENCVFFAREVAEHFQSMGVLTEQEEYLLEKARKLSGKKLEI
jgi:hypothetical protein